MLPEFISNISSQHLFPTTEKVLVAVSGGVDSAVLAHLMHTAGFPFAIAHCNFHLRPDDCDRDEAFVCQLAADYGVPFHVVGFDTLAYAAQHRQSVEEAARELRYEWFSSLCHQYGYPALLTAHHADDVVETFFINLLRGTGLAGLHGILPNSKLKTQNSQLSVVRPLLGFSRAQIENYAERHGLEHVEDVTNASLLYLRNRIRNQLVPLLREISSHADSAILRTIGNLRSVEQLYHCLTDSLRDRYLTHEGEDRIILSTAALFKDFPETLHFQLLFELLTPFGFNASQVQNILTASPGRRYSSSTHQAVAARGRMIITTGGSPESISQGDQDYLEKTPPSVHQEVHPIGELPKDFKQQGEDCLFLDADTVKLPLTLRHWQASDRFQPLGMKGKSQLLSDFFTDHHFTLEEKESQLLLVDADDTILWIVGRRTTHPHRITPETRRFLKVTLELIAVSS